MPFERYLCTDDRAIHHNIDHSYYYQDHRHAYDNVDCHYFHGQHSYLGEATHYDHYHPHAVQLQIPQFMLGGPPILAPGGGAEVLSAGLLDSGPDSLASSWFTKNGFTPFHSTLISRQIASGSTLPDGTSTPAHHIFPHNELQRTPSNFSSHFGTSVGSRQQSLLEPPPPLELPTTYIPNIATLPPSTGSSDTASYALANVLVQDPVSSLPLPVPSSLGFPVYSASGFDALSILSRVVNRPNPAIQLGPVDLSCSFVIVDARRYDCPIVYASPAFCYLTGYSEQEVLGRNCRFLQSPTGNVIKGEPRRFASPEAVVHMRKLLSSSKECQTTLVNYRKGGQAFINLVSVIPLRGGVHNTPSEADEVAYHIGFQVDLTDQPNRILDKLRDGSYCVNNSPWGTSSIAGNGGLPDISYGIGQLVQTRNMTNIGPKGGRHGPMMSIAVSKELRNLIADTTFTDSVPISTGTNMSGSSGASGRSAEQESDATTPLTMLVTPPPGPNSMNRVSAGGNTAAGSIPVSLFPSLSLLLLEFLPDFLLVLSLKGAFLYVAPSVRLALGYESQELVGRSISDVCHPADLVPLMRELKEGSVSGLNIPGTGDVGPPAGTASNVLPKSVDLLFRALLKAPSSSSSKVQDTSTEQADFHPARPASASASSSPLSSGTFSSDDPSGETTPPYVWLECRGRLHVEPGKGRKAIILSGRTRWMPVVRWGSINKAGGVSGIRHQGDDAHGSSRIATGSRPSEMSPGEAGVEPVDPLEFWALLSSQGTFLVASASVRDVLGWGTSEVIGRSIWAVARESRSGMREHVEAELAKLDTSEARGMADPPPTVVTTSLVHKELHAVPVRLAFYRTPRSRKHASPSTYSSTVASTPLVHPLNNPLCPIVCQVTVLSTTEYQSGNNKDASFGPCFGLGHLPGHVQIGTGHETDKKGFMMHPSDVSLFEELETARGSSWQYELQQLKFANQRLQEELSALEGARASGGTVPGSSSGSTEMGHIPTAPPSQPCSSESCTSAVPILQQPQLPQTQLHYVPLVPSTLSSSLHPLNSLHEQDPPSSEWSSLAGANGQGSNPRKRSWRSEDGSTT